MSAIANPRREAELLHREWKYSSFPSCFHLPALAVSLVLGSPVDVAKGRALLSTSAAETCRGGARSRLRQPDPGRGQRGGEEGCRSPFCAAFFSFCSIALSTDLLEAEGLR